MEPHEHFAKVFDAIMGTARQNMGLPSKPNLPHAPRVDDVLTYEDASCTLICDYRIDDYGDDDTAPKCTVVGIVADFGGRDQVKVPINALPGKKLLELETLASDDVIETESKRAQDAKAFPRGER
jgi:hypothetical protein